MQQEMAGAMWTLEELGWNEYFEAAWARVGPAGCTPARVAEERRGEYLLYTERGELGAEIAGGLRHRASGRDDLPAAGDWLAVDARWEESRATIRAVLPRRTKVSRKQAGEVTAEQVVAANVDSILVVCGLDADFNLRRIERYLAVAWESGARPVVLLNKADLCPDVEGAIVAADAAAMGAPVHALSAETGAGFEALESYLAPGRTVALLGSSGVGKSTILNRLIGHPLQRVQEIAEDARGRHTTTARRLVLVAGRGLVDDTPGMRELGLWSAEAGLERAFEDVERLAAGCHFRNCRHRGEPLCAVRDAIDAGELDAGRLESFRKLEREQQFIQLKQDAFARAQAKRRLKQVHKAFRDPRWPL
jgi:ribosome biogenesis GTPase